MEVRILHLESFIQAQKLSFFKRYADLHYASDWKLVLYLLLKHVGGLHLLNFDLNDLPIYL